MPANEGGTTTRDREDQRLAGRLIQVQEEERRRLGRELHDDLSQRLATLVVEARLLERARSRGDGKAAVDELVHGLQALSEDVRRLSHRIHPAALERLGLAAALESYAAELEEREGLRVRLTVQDGEDPLPPSVVLCLYRVAQEALHNAARHSGATTAHLTLTREAGRVRLVVADSGIGFDPAETRNGAGLGLASMEERARLLDGRLEIRSAPGEGTEIEVTVPLPDPAASLRRLVRRHWRPVAAAAVLILTLAGGLVATAVQAHRAEREAMRADTVARFLEELFRASDPRQARGEIPDARELLQRGTEGLNGELSDQPRVKAQLLDTLGGIYTELGLFDEARPLLEEALTLRERLLGPEHPEVASTLIRLGALAHSSGQGDGEPLFRRALALREARLGANDPEVADVLNKLGAALAAHGRLDEAEATLRRALALEERLRGGNDPRVAKVLHNLSGIAFYGGRVEEAERLLERALAIREETLDEDDPNLAGSREALALLRRQQGRTAEAAVLLERLAATAERVYGPEHPHFARALLNLGLARQDLGEAAARRDLERALAVLEDSLAPDHPLVVRALAALADLHFEQERYAEAEPLYRRLLPLHEAESDYQGWDRTLANWASLLRATGRATEADRVVAGVGR